MTNRIVKQAFFPPSYIVSLALRQPDADDSASQPLVDAQFVSGSSAAHLLFTKAELQELQELLAQFSLDAGFVEQQQETQDSAEQQTTRRQPEVKRVHQTVETVDDYADTDDARALWDDANNLKLVCDAIVKQYPKNKQIKASELMLAFGMTAEQTMQTFKRFWRDDVLRVISARIEEISGVSIP